MLEDRLKVVHDGVDDRADEEEDEELEIERDSTLLPRQFLLRCFPAAPSSRPPGGRLNGPRKPKQNKTGAKGLCNVKKIRVHYGSGSRSLRKKIGKSSPNSHVSVLLIFFSNIS